MLKTKRLYLLLLAPFAFLATNILSTYPHIVERYYATGFYRFIAGIFGRVFGAVPFSVAEFVLVFGVVFFLYYIYRQVKIIFALPIDSRFKKVFRLLVNLACIASVLLFVFTITCGLNYHRESFLLYSGLDIHDSSTKELSALCTQLVQKANELKPKLPMDENGVMLTSFPSAYQTAKQASNCYTELGENYPVLSGYTPPPKPVLASKALSAADLVGVYFPYTFEANINADAPSYNTPSTMTHELAHYKGFMREDEANYISYLACTVSDNIEFVYSGTMLALVHSGNALYSANSDEYFAVMDKLSWQVRADLTANDQYWQKFQGPVAAVSTAVNDAYLKTNKQRDGVKSYGGMVDYLLADYRKNSANFDKQG